MTTASRQPSFRAIVLLGAVIALAIAVYGFQSWRAAKENRFAALDNMAFMAASASALFFEHFEVSLRTLSQEIHAAGGLSAPREAQRLLARYQANDPKVVVSNLFTIDGRFAASSLVPPGEPLPDTSQSPGLPEDIGRAASEPGLSIGRVNLGLTSGEWVITMRWAFRDGSGRPLFVVTSNISLDDQQRIWQPVQLQDDGAIGLIRDDGLLQSRWPEVGDPAEIYSAPIEGDLWDALRAGSRNERGRVEGPGTLVKRNRLLSHHRVPGYPLTAYVAISGNAVTKAWLDVVWLPFVLIAFMGVAFAWLYRYGLRLQLIRARELRDRHVQLELRNEIAAHAMQGLPLEEFMRAAMNALVTRFDGMCVAYATIGTDGCWRVRQSAGGEEMSAAWLNVDLPPNFGHLPDLRAGRVVAVSNVATDPAIKRLGKPEAFPVAAIAAAPVAHPGEAMGVLCVGASSPHRWRTSELLLLSQTAEFLSPAINEAHLRAERENALAQLRESEARFRELTELSSDWYWEQDENFRFTFLSTDVSFQMGLNPGSAIGMTRWEQTNLAMSEEEWAAHRAILEAHRPYTDFIYKRYDAKGKLIYFSISGKPIFDQDGRFKGYRGVGKNVTAARVADERIQYLAYHDDLTGLPNRTLFGQMLARGIKRARRVRGKLAVLFVDLDRFKNINDTLGHDQGDLLLKEIGQRIRLCVRDTDAVARLGGDEFVILLEDIGEQSHVASVARKILADVVQPVHVDEQEFRVTASIGISVFPDDGENQQTLMKNADIAMYSAKEDGKNHSRFYSAEMDRLSLQRLTLEASLRRAVEQEQFFLQYQPKVDLRTGAICGLEALVRWRQPGLGIVPPGQFIPLAEETGLIVPIGRWVLEAACKQNRAWQEQGLPALVMAINLSARHFGDEQLLDDIAAALRNSRLAPPYLEVEITESAFMHRIDEVIDKLNRLREMGVRVAVDDFGTGYSSLSSIKRLPIDTLKIDRAFIHDVPGNAEDRALTQTIITMGRTLNLTTVAEGIETREQFDFLLANGCDQYQGYYFSAPLDAKETADLLRSVGKPAKDPAA
ncbi:MAG: EAL domain-containing protein [Burkholderiales bacterium]